MKKRAVAMWLASLLLAVQLLGAGRVYAATASDLSVWSAVKTVTVGDTGTVYPALNFATGRTEQETLTSDLVVEQMGSDYYLYSYAGGFIDLGAVDMAQVPPLSAPWQEQITAVTGHVYLYSGDNVAAKFAVVKTAPGQVSNVPAITLRYATAPISSEQMLLMPSYKDFKPSGTGGGAPAQTAREAQRSILFTEGDKQATRLIRLVDGSTTPTVFPLAAAPKLANGRLMVPMTTLAQAMGADLNWDQATGKASLTLDGITLSLWFGNSNALLTNGTDEVKFMVDAAPAVIDGVQMLPLRLTAGMLGASLEFDASDRTVIVRYPDDYVPQTTAANQPQGVAVTSAGGKVQVAWKAPSGGAPSGGYYVYRMSKADFDPWYPQNDYPLLTRSFTDDTAQAGKTYYYVVEAVNGGRSQPVAVTVSDAPAGPAAKVIKFQENSLTAAVDGTSYKLDAAAQIVSGRMLVPLRFLGDALGADIQYDSASRKITYTLDGRTLVLWQGKTDALLNGKPLTLDVPPTTVNGRTLIPLRFVSENLGAAVEFDRATRVATITYASAGKNEPPAEPESSVNGIRFGIYELRTALIGYTVQFWTPAEIELSGVLINSLLEISPDGTYVWASKWDGRVIKGTWRNFDGASILLSSGESGRDWLVTVKRGAYSAPNSDDIDLYNDSTQYLGRYAGGN